MADGATRSPLYRSVSFKLLERWSGGPGPREEATDPPGLRRRASCRPASAVPGQPSRRVSKLASGPPAAPAQPRPLRSLSPSVRQLSRRFDAPRLDDNSTGTRDGGVSPAAAEEAAEGAARGAWPSVTEMRKLFSGPGSRRPSADCEASGTPSPDGAAWAPPTRESRQPPTPPPRTCFPLAGLRSTRPLPGPGTEGRRRRQQQQQQQERAQRPVDGLHSWHSFSQPQAWARASCSSSIASSYPVSRSRAASSSEEEEEGPPPPLPRAQSPAYHGGHSSGSDEDQDGPQEGLRPLSDTVGGAFRVAKVSFPAYLASPAGSRGSSRYSSTETLKDEDLVLRNGGLELDKSRQRKSLSNPDIASETLTLLSFLRPGAEDDPLPLVVQDQYVQEARQVFEKIQRMGAQQDDGSDRHRATTSEDPSGFSVDSNLLGSLSPKTGLPAAPAVDEGLTSGHSDWSVGSEESKGYQEVIQSIVQGPGTLGCVVDDRVAGKAPKKKSLSDPSRRGELAGPGFEGPGGEPIREVEPVLPPSSSEPILAERQAEPEEPSAARGRAQSERALPKAPPAPSTAHDFHLDPKLADVLSPRLIRRGSKKRPARSSHQELQREEGTQDQTGSLSRARPSSKHVRHASVPATFTPIMMPELPTSVGPPVAVPEPMGFPAQAHTMLQAPSFEDITKQHMLTLHSGEVPAPVPVDMTCLTQVVPPSTEAKPPEAARAADQNVDLSVGKLESLPFCEIKRGCGQDDAYVLIQLCCTDL
ncbi:Rho guanine nucleotide exchange factor 17 [Camelus dromedarius]|uniref:Rho guanine nucleotide exchange factor 17 n=1 Tax=Camelus dromedarius TaxID=9838 RepID=A0A5N4DPF6_CAMDR|nr:Rho guanine nucleotide exchange factor 17 [Camelus dromedarius]